MKNNNSNHVEGKWGIVENRIVSNPKSDDPCRIITIATMGDTFPQHVNEANAKRIVKAVNNHDELVEALYDLLKSYRNKVNMTEEHLIKNALTALKNAEVEF